MSVRVTLKSGAMPRVKIKQARKFFFESRKILEEAGKSSEIALARCGAHVMTIAKRSMRWRKKASKPGEPPSARTDRKPGGGELRRGVVFWKPHPNKVLVGPSPSRYGRKDRYVPDLMEFGGDAPNNRVVDSRGRSRVQEGKPGPIYVVPKRKQARSAAVVRDWQGKKVRVVYATVRGSRMAARAEKLLREIYGPETLNYAPRPYMRPALEEGKKEFSKIYRDKFGRRFRRIGGSGRRGKAA